MQISRHLLVPVVSLAGAVGSATETESRNLIFTIPPNSNTIVNITSTRGVGDTNQPGFLDETNAQYVGSINAALVFDPMTLSVSGFNYSGGVVNRLETPAAMVIFPSIPYISGATLFTSIVRSTSGSPPTTQFSQFTPISVGNPTVDPVTGAISGTLRWDTGVGVEIINGSRSGEILRRVVAPPLTPLQLPHLAEPSITLQQTGNTSFLRIIQAALTYNFASIQNHDIPLSAEQVIVTETGSWTATANFTLPTDYGQWALDNGLVNPDPEGTNEAGIPWIFLYNMDLPPTTSVLPISAVIENGSPKMQIDLPAAGLKLPMAIEFSPTMKNASWLPLSTFYYPPNGAEALDVGATGSPRFSFPIPRRCFMRFTTEL